MTAPLNIIPRKLSAGFKYGLGLLGTKRDDVWLASFPRAGSTWVRFILCNYVYLCDGVDKTADFIETADTMPSLGRSNLLKKWPTHCLPRFIKTHRQYYNFLFFVPERAVYILRDPRDVMVSYFHFCRNLKFNTFTGTFSEFIKHPAYGLNACIKHFDTWKDRYTFLLRYERLLDDAFGEFSKMFDSLKIVKKENVLSEAIVRSAIEKIKKSQESRGLKNKELFLNPELKVARRGKAKQWKDYFSEKDLSFYKNICRRFDFFLYE